MIIRVVVYSLHSFFLGTEHPLTDLRLCHHTVPMNLSLQRAGVPLTFSTR